MQVAKGALSGLVATHDKRVIHRDIKPTNLWRDADRGRIKLLDFGVTRGEVEETQLTQTGMEIGTPAWMAPEQARALKTVDARADLFSLGVVLYWLVSGCNPFLRDTKLASMFALATEIPPSATTFPILPERLAKLIDHTMAKVPEDRPRTAGGALAVVLEVEQQRIATRAGRQVTVPAAPVPPAAPLVLRSEPIHPTVVPVVAVFLPTETVEQFEYAIGGVFHRGIRRMLTLDIGDGATMEFVRISKGEFLMGAPDGEELVQDDEKPQCRVEMNRDFYLGKFPVTQAQYNAVTRQSPSWFQGDQLPVEQVSWDDAGKFCLAVSQHTQRKIMLPSEAQWEYACRAGTITPFHFGSTLNGDLATFDGNHPYGTGQNGDYQKETTVVESYPANPWGLHDMHGNVWEWCQDYYGLYSQLDLATDPIQLIKQSINRRVLRGGSWRHFARYCRAAYRFWFAPAARYGFVGFRVCLLLD